MGVHGVLGQGSLVTPTPVDIVRIPRQPPCSKKVHFSYCHNRLTGDIWISLLTEHVEKNRGAVCSS